MLLGAATGLRTTSGLAALIVTRNDGLPGVLRRPAARAAAAAAVGVELVIDKLPMTGSRLAPGQLTGRLCAAAAAGAALARSDDVSQAAAAAAAAGAALAAAKTGYELRAALSTHLPPTVVAVAEDTLAILLAARAA